MSCIKPNKTENNIYTDTKELEKYINLPVAIQKADMKYPKRNLGNSAKIAAKLLKYMQ